MRSWWLCCLTAVGAGCERPKESPPPAPALARSERAPIGLQGTFRLGPVGLTQVTAAEDPLVYLDLDVAGDTIRCAPWRPDEQTVRCEAALWLPPDVQLELTRSYQSRWNQEEIEEKWYLRARLEETEDSHTLVGSLTIQRIGGNTRSFRVEAPRVIIDTEEAEQAFQAIQAANERAAPPPTGRTQDEAPGTKTYGAPPQPPAGESGSGSEKTGR